MMNDEPEIVEPVWELTTEEEVQATWDFPSLIQKLENIAAKHSLLDAVEELDLVRRAQKNDRRAMDRLYKCNLGLIKSLAKKYGNKKLPLEDLMQEAAIGFFRAVMKFNTDSGLRLSTYAYWWIRQHTTRAVVNKSRTIRIPIHGQADMDKVRKVYSQLREKHQRRPTVSELAEATGMPADKIERIGRNMQEVMSLDEPIGDEEGLTRLSIETAPSNTEPECVVEGEWDLLECHKLLNKLSPEDRELILFYYGFFDDGRDKDDKALLEYANLSQKDAQKRLRRIIARLRSMADHHSVNMSFLTNVILQSLGNDMDELRAILRQYGRVLDKEKRASRLSEAQIDAIIKGSLPVKVSQISFEDAEPMVRRLKAIGCKVSMVRK